MFKDIAPKPDGTVLLARRLRQTMSLPEGLLWRELRKRPLGIKFRRQHPTGPFVVDFFCSDARLAIEIDGSAHDFGNRPQRDMARDEWFAGNNIATLRIPARCVLKDVQAAVRHIIDQTRARLPLHHPAAPGGPPPRDELGEE